MFNSKVLSMLVVGLAVGTAQAAETNRSEFFYQPSAGVFDITGNLGYKMLTQKGKETNATESKANGLVDTGAELEYGLNEMISVGGGLFFTSMEGENSAGVSTGKVSGLQDPMLFVKGTSALDFGRLRFGAELGLGFQNREYKTVNGVSEVGAGSGGFSIDPYVGIDLDAGPGILGARLNYRYNLERTWEFSGGPFTGEAKFTGGNELGLAAFYEYLLSDMLLGGAFDYRMVSDMKNQSGTIAEESHNIMGLDLYARIPAAEHMAVIPRMSYDFSNSHLSKLSDLTLSIAGRLAF